LSKKYADPTVTFWRSIRFQQRQKTNSRRIQAATFSGTRHEKQQSQKLPGRRHSLLQRTIPITQRQATSHTTSNDIIRIQGSGQALTTATDSSTTTDDNRSHCHGNSTRACTVTIIATVSGSTSVQHHRCRLRRQPATSGQFQCQPINVPERLRHRARSPLCVRSWRRHEKELRSVRQNRNTRRRHPQHATFDDYPRFRSNRGRRRRSTERVVVERTFRPTI